MSTTKHTESVNVSVIELKIEAKSKEEILAIISDELKKYSDIHSFNGSLYGRAKDKPIIIFEDDYQAHPHDT